MSWSTRGIYLPLDRPSLSTETFNITDDFPTFFFSGKNRSASLVGPILENIPIYSEIQLFLRLLATVVPHTRLADHN